MNRTEKKTNKQQSVPIPTAAILSMAATISLAYITTRGFVSVMPTK